MTQSAFAPGKIILSGEYAVLFGYPGIAIPSTLGIDVTFEPDGTKDIRLETSQSIAHPEWRAFVEKILAELRKEKELPGGTLRIEGTLPFGKGMGSSTALLIAIAKVFDCNSKEHIRAIENILTPGNSGLDFEVIWNEKPMLREGTDTHPIDLDLTFLRNAILIDTGLPDQTTSELVRVIKEQKNTLEEPLHAIMHCTQDLLNGKDPFEVFRRHHKAQVALGVVPEPVQKLIAGIEQLGCSAKVIGAGSRTGGGGMVLAIQKGTDVLSRLASVDYPVHSL